MPIAFQGIDKIYVKGYKSIVDETIQLRQITVLAGANSSGKSSIMQPLLLLKQTLEEKSGIVPLRLDGENVYLTQYSQIRPRFEHARHNEFKIGVENYFLRATSTFRYSEQAQQIYIFETNFDLSPYARYSGRESYADIKFVLSEGMLPPEVQKVAVELGKYFRGINSDKLYELKKDSCFLSLRPNTSQDEKDGIPSGPDDTVRPAGSLSHDIRGVIHLSGVRGEPSRRLHPRRVITPLSAEDAPMYLFKGKFPDYTASLIAAWEQEKNGRIEQLTEYVQYLRLTTAVSTKYVDDSFLEILVGWHPTEKPAEKEDMVNIADVGCGVSQVLPILVALIAATRSQTVYIEQPEIHLHPKASIALAYVISKAVTDAAKRGVRVVIETHSDLLLLALQTVIAKQVNESDLTPKNVILYWFEKQSDGTTRIKEGVMDDYGDYGDWPEDFVGTAMALQHEYLEAYFERKNRKNMDGGVK